MTRSRVFAALGLGLGTAGALGVGVGSPALAASSVSCPGVVDQSQVSPPSGYRQVVNAEMSVNNDEDSGFVGYWALTNYTKHLQVWADSSRTNFYVAVTYHGTWSTFAGALSPENGVSQPSDGNGSIAGGYIGTMNGSMLTDPTEPTHGTVGTYNYEGTESDVLLGSYGAGQTGPTNPTDWLDFYFPSATVGTFAFANGGNDWGWRYTGNTTSGPWCNTGMGSSGDIVTH